MMHIMTDWEQQTDWAKLRKWRVERMVAVMKKKGIRAVLLAKLDTIRYATSFHSVQTWMFHGNRHIAIVTDEGHVSLLVASGDYKRVKDTMPWLTDVEPFPFVMSEGYPIVEKKLNELGIKSGKVGIDMMAFDITRKLRLGFPDIDFVEGGCVVEEAQLLKSPEEIQCLRVCANAVDVGMTAMLDNIHEGISEMELSRICMDKYMEFYPDDIPYFPLVLFGEHSWQGYRHPGDKRLRRGDMIWMDAGCCIINGYNGDIARCAFCGDPTPEQKKLYTAIYDMLWYGIEALNPGAPLSAPLKAAYDAADKHGLGDKVYFGILGHGIGTDLHIAPTIGDLAVEGGVEREVNELSPTQVIALEPGIFVEGVGGGCCENMTLITETGHEVLTHTRFEDRLLVR